MSFKVFYTHIGVQGKEDICELWYYLVPFLPQHGPFCILVIVASNREILFLNSIPKRTPSGYEWKKCGFLHGLFLILSIPPILDMGDNLKEHKGDVFSIEKIMDKKKSFEWFKHLSMESASI